jgi:hypothetical protein
MFFSEDNRVSSEFGVVPERRVSLASGLSVADTVEAEICEPSLNEALTGFVASQLLAAAPL